MEKGFEALNEHEELIISFLKGELSAEQAKNLFNWIKESDSNRKNFQEIRNLWLGTSKSSGNISGTGLEVEWNNVKNRINQPSVLRLYEESHRNSERLRKIYRIAATFLLIFTLGYLVSWYVLKNSSLISYNHTSMIDVPKGSRSHITLPDGSEIWLNAGSKITYNSDFNLNDRIVILVGEAYFNVASDRKKPFVVRTSNLDIRAYGTVFNVKSYPDENEIVTTLVNGNVQIVNNDNSSQKISYNLKPGQNFKFIKIKEPEISHPKDSTIAEPGKSEPVKVVEPAKSVEIEKNVKTNLYTSWKDDRWIIEGETLSDLAPQLERRYNINIIFGSDKIKNYRFTGNIHNETFEQVLDILRLTTPIKYEMGKGWVRWNIDLKLEAKYDKILKK